MINKGLHGEVVDLIGLRHLHVELEFELLGAQHAMYAHRTRWMHVRMHA
jgi:hypothetical protein